MTNIVGCRVQYEVFPLRFIDLDFNGLLFKSKSFTIKKSDFELVRSTIFFRSKIAKNITGTMNLFFQNRWSETRPVELNRFLDFFSISLCLLFTYFLVSIYIHFSSTIFRKYISEEKCLVSSEQNMDSCQHRGPA